MLHKSQDQDARISPAQRREAFLSYLEQAREKEADLADIPKKVQSALATRYPAVETIGWVRINRDLFGVFFLDKVWFKFARFNAAGVWDDTRVFSLSRDARQRIAKVLDKMVKDDFEIIQLERLIKSSGEKLWEVLLEIDGGMVRVVLDENEKLIARYEIESGPDDERSGAPDVGDDDDDSDDDEEQDDMGSEDMGDDEGDDEE